MHTYLPEKVYGDDGKCIRCGVMPMLQSFDGDARKVFLQLMHTANREAGLLPPMQEVAKLQDMSLARVQAAFDVLEARGVIGPLDEGLKGDFEGQYMARWASHKDALANMERRARLAEQAAISNDDQRDVERDLREEIEKLKRGINSGKGLGARLRAANKRIKELEQAMESLQQMLEREKSVPR